MASVVEVRERERALQVRKGRGESTRQRKAENGSQRRAKQSSRSVTVKRAVAEHSRRSEKMKAKQNSRNGKQAISD